MSAMMARQGISLAETLAVGLIGAGLSIGAVAALGNPTRRAAVAKWLADAGITAKCREAVRELLARGVDDGASMLQATIGRGIADG